MININDMLTQQLEKEKQALSIYQQAKRVAQQNQAKSKGFLGRLFAGVVGESTQELISRSAVISVLNRLSNDEMGHIKLVDQLILESNEWTKEPEKQ